MLDIGFYDIVNETQYIDVNISNEVIDNIIVRVHPNCDFADRLLIESLLYKYTNNGKLELSNLNDNYRTR
ncbi:hypothetical protein [Chishuiella sp.]|uniref:hypothetical protein n=1 Tax=Chishuiella sp. TaxID=1969467 RepID=UPI0028A9260D|nr:hypothetical protein [Chishuiella sp.]